MERKTTIIVTFLTMFGLVFMLSSVTMITPNVMGANRSNDTLITRVNVWNTEPTLYNVDISPNPIFLVPGNTTQVNCTGYVFDYNGWSDIEIVNATLFHASSNNDELDDNNYHYTNNSRAACSQVGSSDTNASCLASFNVWYYAFNGTWTCNMTISDTGGNSTSGGFNFSSSNNDTAELTTVLGIKVPDEIDYGNLSVTEISDNISVNVTNWGNVPINISVKAFAGTNETFPTAGNYSMFCEFGNITPGYQRYTVNSGTPFVNMINVTNVSTGINNFELPARTNDTQYENDTNTTYWKLEVPLSVSGFCNGTIIFSAIDMS